METPTPFVDKNLGLQFQKWREGAKLDQDQLARQLGCQAAYVRQCESGQRRPDCVLLFAWADACGVSWKTVQQAIKEAIKAQDDAAAKG